MHCAGKSSRSTGMTVEIIIESLEEKNKAPMDLLLLADPSEEMIREYTSRGECYVARSNDEIVGVLILLKTRPHTMEIMNVAVQQEAQNKGVGRRLIRHAIAEAKHAGAKTVEIGTGNPGVQQMLLYQKCGFRIVGVEFDYFRNINRERIYENGIECRDMIRLRMDL
jgi:ribosomal protein S18 acetylase RimI-like enzyme